MEASQAACSGERKSGPHHGEERARELVAMVIPSLVSMMLPLPPTWSCASHVALGYFESIQPTQRATGDWTTSSPSHSLGSSEVLGKEGLRFKEEIQDESQAGMGRFRAARRLNCSRLQSSGMASEQGKGCS